jgi:hypothetical protein
LDGACGTQGGARTYYKTVLGKPKGNRTLARPCCAIKMDGSELRLEGVHWVTRLRLSTGDGFFCHGNGPMGFHKRQAIS